MTAELWWCISEQGDYINKFNLPMSTTYPKIAFHKGSQQVIVAALKEYNSDLLTKLICTKDGEFVLLSLWESPLFWMGLQGPLRDALQY